MFLPCMHLWNFCVIKFKVCEIENKISGLLLHECRIIDYCIKKRLQWNTCFARKVCKEGEYYEEMMRYLRKNLAVCIKPSFCLLGHILFFFNSVLWFPYLFLSFGKWITFICFYFFIDFFFLFTY